MKLLKQSQILINLLLVSCVGFSITSWWLLFRDQRALEGITHFYPNLATTLASTQLFLMGYGLNLLPTLVFAILAITAVVAYISSLKSEITIKTSVVYALLFQIIVCISYPILSTDIFSYIFSDRVFTEYSQNVWKVTPDTFSTDPYERLADWKDQTKVYGAVNQLVYLPASYMGGKNLLLTVILYKVTALLFSMVTLFLILKLTEKYSETKSASIIRLIFWNPLFLLEILGSGHNDIAMLFFFLLSYFFYQKKSWLLAGLILALSVQVKLITVVFFAFTALQLLQQRQFTALVKFCLGFVLINALSFWFMNINPLDFLQRVLYNTSVYWQSLPSVTHRFFENEKPLFTAGLLLFVIGLIYSQIKYKLEPILTTTAFLLGYLLFFSAAYWNWYVLWLLLLIPFCKVKWLQFTVLLFTFTSLGAYPLLWISQRFEYQNIAWQFIYYVWIFVVPLAGLFLFYKKPKTVSFITDNITNV